MSDAGACSWWVSWGTHGELYRVLRQSGIADDGVLTSPAGDTGITLIEVDAASGDNRIVYVPGVNRLMDKKQIDSLWPRLMQHDFFLMQLETPLSTVAYAARRLSEAGKTVILDPAPAQPLPEELFRHVSYLTPNETELNILTGLPTGTREQLLSAACTLVDKGARAVIAKAGRQGAYLVTAEEILHAPGFRVTPVDTTAAGDSFNAGFVVALSQGRPVREALQYANAVAAQSTLGAGAQGAMPTAGQVEAFLAQRPDEAQVVTL